MAIAVSLWFDAELEARIRALWQKLAMAGIHSSLFDGRYRPHITLGAWEFGPRAELEAALRVWLADKVRFGVEFPSVGLFPDDDGVVFLQPHVTTALLALQREAFTLVSRLGNPASPYFDPGRWVPHCTMAWGVPREKILQAAALVLGRLSIKGTVAAVGVIDTPAEVELKRFDLRAQEP